MFRSIVALFYIPRPQYFVSSSLLFYRNSLSTLSVKQRERKRVLGLMTLAADIIPIPVNKDNYSYLITDRSTNIAGCVDAFDPSAVLKHVSEHKLDLLYCLTTHYHQDHAGGNKELRRRVGNKVTFIGSAYEDTPEVTERKKDLDVFYIGNLQCTAILAKCHTQGHIMYYIENRSDKSSEPLLITGDTLFVGGCGRFFEGNGQDMINIVRKLNSLDPNTHIYPGHEYSINNLQFALSIEPNNTDIKEALERSISLLKQGAYPIGITLQEEKKYNPFLRCHILKNVLGCSDDVACMEECRTRKNAFSASPNLNFIPIMWQK